MFFKIPSKFTINTPIGEYNSDLAVYMTKHGEEKLYFVLETKRTLEEFDRREKENQKIKCCIEHFKALDCKVNMGGLK